MPQTKRTADVVVVGGGMVGATVAAMLGDQGIDCVLLEQATATRADFRCEKVDAEQLDRLARCGLGDALDAVGTINDTIWVGRGGRVLEVRAYRQLTAPYSAMVQAMRARVGGTARVMEAKVARIQPHPTSPVVECTDGSSWRCRVVAVATGPSRRILESMGVERQVLSPRHSLSMGFDLAGRDGSSPPYSSVTWFPERFDGATSYLTVFQMGAVFRANLFVYRPPSDPWIRRFQHDPLPMLQALMPRFVRLSGPLSVVGPVRTRFVDLYTTQHPMRPGVVLLGDAFASSDPAAGNGFDKVWNDAYYFARECVPGWLAAPNLSEDSLLEFYAHPEKVACDTWCRERALQSRQVATSRRPYWVAHRLGAWGVQATRGLGRRLLKLGRQ